MIVFSLKFQQEGAKGFRCCKTISSTWAKFYLTRFSPFSKSLVCVEFCNVLNTNVLQVGIKNFKFGGFDYKDGKRS